MHTTNLLAVARKHVYATDDSSARFCLANAVQQYDNGAYDAARMWALKSLRYSVGVFHADYKKAAA